MQNRGTPAKLRHDLSRVMAAYIVEGAQLAIGPADRNDRLVRDCGGYELPEIGDLIGTSDHLPGLAENGGRLELGDPRIYVPGGGNRKRLRERSAIVVAGQDLLQRKLSGHPRFSLDRNRAKCIRPQWPG